MSGSYSGGGSDDTAPDSVIVVERTSSRNFALPGYDIADAIGTGGMGEVLAARDRAIGRDVAIKRMRAIAPSSELIDRFLREAKIQARLDHPAIVPVYELGHDRDGAPYFTMKRLAGTTLRERLAAKDTSLQTLLRALIDVCHAIELAHARGVVHRDLKPANIMLGYYGEVYVLDWGIARVIDRADVLTPHAGSPSVQPDGRTQAGALLGTAGYMAPEQARGETVGTAADIYALGAILFEILAGEALHPEGPDAIATTLAKPEQSPASRRRDRAIPPELDEACSAALAALPTARPTARELADRLQRYLDGDRDLERRRALASEHVRRATAIASDPARRAEAIRDAGRALALDPESSEAATLVMSLVLEAPRALPTPLEEELDANDQVHAIRASRAASIGLASMFLLLPLVLWAAPSSVPLTIALFTMVGILAVDAHLQVRRRKSTESVPLTIGSLTIILLSQVLSPFVLQPLVIAGFVVGLGQQSALVRRPALMYGVGLVVFVAPLVLEALGVFAHTWEVTGGHLVITSALVHLDGTLPTVLLVAAHVMVLAVVCALLRSVTLGRRDARRALEIQAWQLRQLLPAAAAKRSIFT